MSPAEEARDGRFTRGALRRSTLPPRSLLGFTAAILAVFVIAALSYRSLQSRSESARRLNQTVEATEHLEGVISTLKDAETGQRGFLLTGSELYLEPYEAALIELPKEIARVRRTLSGDPEQLERLEAVDRMSTEKLAELAETIELQRAGRTDAALAAVKAGGGRETMDRLRTAVAEMKDREFSQMDAYSREWETAVTLSTTVTWGGAALLLFLIIVAGMMSARDFRDQRLQAWLRTGQNELGRRTQGDQSLEQLGDKVLGFLGAYLDAQIGALYFAEAAGDLRCIGGFALPNDASRMRGVGGLTRQAYDEKTTLYVRDVPEDYFPVSSALGASRPRHLVVVPATADAAPNGVIELGFFHAVADHDLELLRRVAEQVGVALRSAKYRREVHNLLEETQRQAEELQTQQEELRVQNEELEQQTRALQESQQRLQNQQAELEQINSQLEEQTQSLEHQRDELTRAQTELTRANVYKSEFLANMSHELRTPLNSSLILAKLLADNRDGNLNAEQIKFAQTIYSAGNDLLTLINDILDLSKIEAGKLDVRLEDVALGRLVDDLENTFQPMAAEKRLELAMSLDEGLPPAIHTDPTRLQQILKNLLSNAIKFTERGGVTLRVQRLRTGQLSFEVQDTGIGIPASQHGVVFEAFRQADGTTNRKYGGTGLGLSISRDLAALLGGELLLDSAPGRGSTFTLLLPDQYLPKPDRRERAPGPLRRARPAAQSSGPAAEASRPATAVTDDRERVPPGSRAILIIEDDPRFARVIGDLAHELDFQVLLAQNAGEGLAMAERYRPSGVVLDVGLPDRSGLSVLDALKHDPATRHIPVHMISVDDYTQAALEMGAAGYAVKPVQREQLIDALQRLEAKFTQKLRRVLVVEDDEVHRESTCRLLAADDVETVAVGTAAAALEQLGASTFDCMVLDLSLPDRNGFELLEDMLQKEQCAFPPVIVYTGRSLSREEEQQLRRFSNSIIIKGARSPERLLDEVTLFLHQVESELPPDRQRMLRDARHREAVFEGKRVLVVEDDVRNIFALSSVLEPKGARVEIARNGREALEHLREKPGVDLVLMDVMMPEMDGLEATRAIRKLPELARLPIIALTAKAMADDRDQCLAAGANDYIAKPLDVDKLLSLVRVWMPK